jgi:hypothetical protein
MYQYVVVTYDDRPQDDNEIQIIHVTDNLDYAEKLAFHYAKKELPPKSLYGRTECRIIKNYQDFNSLYLHDVVVDYKICEVKYNDECEKYDIADVWNNVWAVVKIDNEINETVEDIDETVIYKDNM